MRFDALAHPVTWLPVRHVVADPAALYAPFGFFLVDRLRPSTIVELGTASGVFYAALCQAVQALGLPSTGLAVADQAGHGADARDLSAFRDHHDSHFSAFSTLSADGPDAALARLADGTLDVLSLTGSLDPRPIWKRWRSKLGDNGVLVVTGVGRDHHGARAFWADVQRQYPSFELPGDPGLGLAAVGCHAQERLADLVGAVGDERDRIVAYFVGIGRSASGDLARAHQLVAGTDAAIHERDQAIGWLRGELAQTQKALRRVEQRADWYALQLETIFASRSWRLLARYRRLRERVGLRSGRRLAAGPVPPAIREDVDEGRHASEAPPRLVGNRVEVAAATDPRDALTLLPRPDIAAADGVVDQAWAATTRRRVDVICFAIIDWEFRFQRPQQIATQFAAHGHRVFFVSPSRFRRPGEPPGVREITDRVFEVELAALRQPDIYGENVTGELAQSILASLDDLRRSHDISSAVSFVMLSAWTDVVLGSRDRWRWPVVYDCMDEWENFQGIKRAIVEAEQTLVRTCDLLVVTAARLEAKWAPLGRPMVLARNAVDLEFYTARYRPNPLLAGVKHPIVGYYGAIADWFDLDLMLHVARSRPQYTFVLLGGVFDVDVSALKALPNVSLLGQQPYATMPQYLYHFDVCLIPFKVNPITEATDPVKLYEYLSAGKPVVTVDLPELAPCREHVYVARSHAEFLHQLDRAVAEQDQAAIERRKAFVAQHTWSARYDVIADGIAQTTRPASIVIVTFNNLTLTRLCLESILRNTDHPNYEVIVVDNASTDGTPAYLRYLAARDAHVKVVQNDGNLGFARANNQGIAVATGEDLVLLNNDTVVPHGWLSRLLGHLRDPAIGLVGPVTNFVGNEAKVDVPYRTWGEMEEFATERWRRYEGQVADISVLAMFCVAMRRGTWERVGPLDEQFEIGMFEDDDYAHRVVAAGLRVVCAGDTFVHHVGQAAFKVLIDRGQYDPVFDANRRRYEAKWRRSWQPHVHRALPFSATVSGSGNRLEAGEV